MAGRRYVVKKTSDHFGIPIAIIRCCCPCCLRGEPEEKEPRVRVSYGKEKSQNYVEENVNYINPEEQPEDAANENSQAVREKAEENPEPDHDAEDEGKDIDREVVEYTDENGVKVRRTVKKTVTTTTTRTTSGGDDSPKNLTRNILEMSHDKPEDDGSEVVEYVEENGRRVRRIVKKTITTIVTKNSSKRDRSSGFTTETKDASKGDHDPGKEAALQLESKPPSFQEREVSRNILEMSRDNSEDDGSEVVEYVDENGRRVRRIVKKTITTTISSKNSSNLDGSSSFTTKTEETSKEDHDSGKEAEVQLKSKPASFQDREMSKNIMEMSRDKSEDDSGEVVEYVDENGRSVRRIVKKTITTISTKDSSNLDGSSSFTTETEKTSKGDHHLGKEAEVQLESKPPSFENREVSKNILNMSREQPEDDGSEVVEYVDEIGRRVRQIVKKTITTTISTKDSSNLDGSSSFTTETEETSKGDHDPKKEAEVQLESKPPSFEDRELSKSILEVSRDKPKDDGSEVVHYEDENGRFVRQIVKKTITTTISSKKSSMGDESSSFTTQTKETSREDNDPGKEAAVQLQSKPASFQDREVPRNILELSRGQPEDDGSEVVEYVGENGRRVRQIEKKTITTTISTKDNSSLDGLSSFTTETKETSKENHDKGKEAEVQLESKPPSFEDREVSNNILQVTRYQPEDDGSEGLEYVDENGRRVRQILKKTITTTISTKDSSNLDGLSSFTTETKETSKENHDPGEEAEVQLKSKPPSFEDREVSNNILQVSRDQPEDAGSEVVEYVDENGRRVRQVVKETITTTISSKKSLKNEESSSFTTETKDTSREDNDPEKEAAVQLKSKPPSFEDREVSRNILEMSRQQPEDDDSKVVEYVDENDRRVRQMVKKTITTTISTTNSSNFDGSSSFTTETEETSKGDHDPGKEAAVQLESKPPSFQDREVSRNILELSRDQPEDDGSELVEYVDENERRVRQMVKKTITTTISTTNSSDLDGSSSFTIETEDTSKEDHDSGNEAAVLLESKPPSFGDREVSSNILQLSCDQPEDDGSEVVEYVDENGRRVRQIVKKTITTTISTTNSSNLDGSSSFTTETEETSKGDHHPGKEAAVHLESKPPSFEDREVSRNILELSRDQPEDDGSEVVEYVNENGRSVRRIVKKTIITTNSTKSSSKGHESSSFTTETEETSKEDHHPGKEAEVKLESKPPSFQETEVSRNILELSRDQPEDDGSEIVENVDKNGRRVRQIVKKTITTTISTTNSSNLDGSSSFTTETEETSKEDHDPGKEAAVQLESKPPSFEDREVSRNILELSRDQPEDDGSKVVEYVDENGRRVRQIAKKTITTTTSTTNSSNLDGSSSFTTETEETSKEDHDPGKEAEVQLESKPPSFEDSDVSSNILQLSRDKPEDDGSEVLEYVDENCRRVRQIVKTTITSTISTTKSSNLDGSSSFTTDTEETSKEDHDPRKEAEVQLESKPPSFQEREVSKNILELSRDKREDDIGEVGEYVDENGRSVRRILKKTIITTISTKSSSKGDESSTFTTETEETSKGDHDPGKEEEVQLESKPPSFQEREMSRNILELSRDQPENDGSEVMDYVGENDRRVRQIAKRTITTTISTKDSSNLGGSSSFTTETEETSKGDHDPGKEAEVQLESKPPSFEDRDVSSNILQLSRDQPEDDGSEIVDYVDDNGRRVRQIVKKTITTTISTKDSSNLDGSSSFTTETEETSKEDHDPGKEEEVQLESKPPSFQEREVSRNIVELSRDQPEDDGSEVMDYVGENDRRVRQIAKRTITTTISTKDSSNLGGSSSFTTETEENSKGDHDPGKEAEVQLESKPPSVQDREVSKSSKGDESSTFTTETEETSKGDHDPGKEEQFLLESKPPSFQDREVSRNILELSRDQPEDDGSEIVDYVDDNGRRVRQIVKKTITTTISTKDSSNLDGSSSFTTETAETSKGDHDPGKEAEVQLESKPPSFEDRRVSSNILQLSRDKPEDDGSEVVEYVDENGRRVRQIVKKTITTRISTKDSSNLDGSSSFTTETEETSKEDHDPRKEAEVQLESKPPSFQEREVSKNILKLSRDKREDDIGEVGEYVDDNGRSVRRILKKTITTTISTKDSSNLDGSSSFTTETGETSKGDHDPGKEAEVQLESNPPSFEDRDVSSNILQLSRDKPEDDGSEVVDYVDENGRRVRQIAKRTITTTISTKDSSNLDGSSSFTTETGETSKGDHDPGKEAEVQLESKPRSFEDRDVSSNILQLSRDKPEDDGSEVWEYVDENGRRVRQIVKKTITTTISTTKSSNLDGSSSFTTETEETSKEDRDPGKEAEVQLESKPPSFQDREVSKNILELSSDKREDDIGEVGEYVDDNGRSVRRIVKKTITTTISTKSSSKGDESSTFTTETEETSKGDHDPGNEEEVQLESKPPSFQEREVSRNIMELSRDQPEDDGSEIVDYVGENGRRVRQIAKRTIKTTISTKDSSNLDGSSSFTTETEETSKGDRYPGKEAEVQLESKPPSFEDRDVSSNILQMSRDKPEDDGSEVVEYVDENGRRVRQIVEKTITTTISTKDSSNLDGSSSFTTEIEETSKEDHYPGKEAEVQLESKPPSFQDREVSKNILELSRDKTEDDIGEVGEYVDENGRSVRRIGKKTITTTISTKSSSKGDESSSFTTETEMTSKGDHDPGKKEEFLLESKPPSLQDREVSRNILELSRDQPEDDGSEIVDYVDENGQRVRQIAKKTTTKTISTKDSSNLDGSSSFTTETGETSKGDHDPGKEAEVQLESKPPSFEDRDVSSNILQLSRDKPEDDGSEVVEYVDENGRRVRQIVKKTITTRISTKDSSNLDGSSSFTTETEETSKEDHDPGKEAKVQLESKPPSFQDREVSKNILELSRDKAEDDIGEVWEYVDENGRSGRRIVKKTIKTTISTKSSSKGDVSSSFTTETEETSKGDYDAGNEEEVQLESKRPSFQEREVFRDILEVYRDQQEDDGSEVLDYVDENGRRVRQIAKRMITTTISTKNSSNSDGSSSFTTETEKTSKEDHDPGKEAEVHFESKSPSFQDREVSKNILELSRDKAEDDIGEVGEYVDENGRSVRRIVKKTIITTISTKSSSKGGESSSFTTETEETSKGDHDAGNEEEVQLESKPPSFQEREVSRDILESSRDQPEDDGSEVVDYVDENGRRVRQIAKRTITTTNSTMDSSNLDGSSSFTTETEETSKGDHYPGKKAEVQLERKPPSFEDREVSNNILQVSRYIPEDDGSEVVEYVDENGRRVRQIVEKTITTTISSKDSSNLDGSSSFTTETEETSKEDHDPGKEAEVQLESKPPSFQDREVSKNILVLSRDKAEDDIGEVGEYVDDNGRSVRRIVKKTIITTISTKSSSKGDESSSFTTETEETSKGDHDPGKEEEFLLERKPPSSQDREVSRNLLELSRDQPEDDGSEIVDYVDENGRRVRQIAKKTMTTMISTKDSSNLDGSSSFTTETEKTSKEDLDPGKEAEVQLESKPLSFEDGDVSNNILQLSRDKPEDDGSEVVEYVDENGRRVRQIVKKKITTTISTTNSSYLYGSSSFSTEIEETSKEDHDPGKEAEVQLESKPPSFEEREVSKSILEVSRDKPEDDGSEVVEYVDENGRRVRQIVKKTITSTISSKKNSKGDESSSFTTETKETSREDTDPGKKAAVQLESRPPSFQDRQVSRNILELSRDQPEDDGSEVVECVDENGRRVRQIVKKTITTTISTKNSSNLDGSSSFTTETEETSKEDHDPGKEAEVQLESKPLSSQDREVSSDILQVSRDQPEDDGSEVVESVDENGRRVRRFLKITITTISTKNNSNGDESSSFTTETKDTSKEDYDRGKEAAIQLESKPPSFQDREVSRNILEVSRNKFEDDGGEVVEYVDENGRRVQRIVKKTITTTISSKDSSNLDRSSSFTTETEETSKEDHDPGKEAEVQLESRPPSFQDREMSKNILVLSRDKAEDDIGEVGEYVDDNGRSVRRIVKKTIITTISTKSSSKGDESSSFTTETEETSKGDHDPGKEEQFLLESKPPSSQDREVSRNILELSRDQPEDDGSEIVDYVDENGRRVRQIAKKTMTTTISTKDSSNGDGFSSFTTETEKTSKEDHDPGKEAEVQLESKPLSFEDREVSNKILQVSRDQPEDDGSEVVEYVDENERIVKKTITTTISKEHHDLGKEAAVQLESKPRSVQDREVLRNILEVSRDESEDDGSEVVEYVDKNGRRIPRIGKKTITTTISIKKDSNGDGSSSFTTETNEASKYNHGPGKQLLQLENKPPSVQDRDVLLQFDTKPQAKQERLINSEIKDQANERAFPRHEMTKSVENRGHTTVTTKSSGGNQNGDCYSSVFKRTVVTKTIEGREDRSVVEHSTKPSGRDGEHPIVVVKKDQSQIDVPEWMEERKSPETQRQHPEISDISVHLKYPSVYAPKKKEPEEKANESKIRAEVSKRDKPGISILSLDDVVKEKEKGKEEVKKSENTEVPLAPQPASADSEEEEDDDEEEEEEEEYDEFEEELVILEVKRRPRYHKGLKIPNPEPEKVGIPIEDLLEIPTMQVDQESAPEDELLTEEKIEVVERTPVVFCELPDFESLKNF